MANISDPDLANILDPDLANISDPNLANISDPDLANISDPDAHSGHKRRLSNGRLFILQSSNNLFDQSVSVCGRPQL